ncbi:MAG: potassium-transporting ATPase subunit F [Chloroflexi bacterium]|uniref:Potassium-transporting ATPase subunit F n=1 Tax=Candidatus Chlorohelix allophototropha TaxID=3003348 RepID=A0A8T7LXC3_9CHLR|nr:potassium-transporting ATPase subunit F [Chloroflexota bacterium]WJW67486.1 potassium-transporting ATPase subunit F [Chloroflexota bacterium L227-S17]
MPIDMLLGLIAGILLLIYLTFALLQAEKF